MVRRRTRKDPGQLSRRVGLPASMLFSLLAVFALPQSHAAPVQGPTSKSTRVEPAQSQAGPVHFNLNFLPWRKASATRQSLESVVTRGRAPQEQVQTQPKGASSYLPVSGPVPLRYASARTWPDRMAPAEQTALSIALAPDPDLAIRRDALVADHAAGVPAAPLVTPPETAPVTLTAASASAAESRGPQIVARPVFYGMGEAVLTSDLVLRSLDNMPTDGGAVPSQFRPAVPTDRFLDSVPVAVAR